jgi:glycosyltransferase involved in cell wall biosynthesis
MYGFRFTRAAREFRPDVILSCNDPLGAKAVAGLWAWVRRVPWVFWLQDVYSAAMSRELEKRGIPFGQQLGRLFEWVERRLLRSAAAVVVITDDFLPLLRRWGVSTEASSVIQNWAPIDELPVRARENSWREDTGLGDRFTFVYSGTLGLKHDPGVLYALAEHLACRDAIVVVVSEGLGKDHLRELQSIKRLPNLLLLPFQPYELLPEVLGAADVLVVLLEPEAGTFSVPSKVLTCLCAERPILAMMPTNNLAARTIERAGAGRVIAPGSTDRFLEVAVGLMENDGLRTTMGKQARAYAELTFDGDAIADQFETVLDQAVTSTRRFG